MKKIALTCLLALAGISTQALAGGTSGSEGMGIVVRAGAAMVDPAGDGLTVSGVGKIDVEDNTQLGLNISYPLGGNLALGVLGATPFKHDITLNGKTIGSTKHLPPTVTLQYHFNPGSGVNPYVGLGANYTKFFDEDSSLGSLNLDTSTGLAAEVGVDWSLNKNWALNAAAWYADIDTEATLGGKVLGDVAVDPWVYMVGVAYKF